MFSLRTVTAVTLASLALPATAAAERLYVVNDGDDSVSVVELTTGTTFSPDITVGNSPKNVAITPNGARAYVSNGDDGDVTVIDLATNTPVGSPIPIGDEPRDIVMAPNGAKAYVISGAGGAEGDNVSVIDLATNTVTATIELDENADPRGLAITPNGSFLYVSNREHDDVTVISTATNARVGTDITVGNQPHGVAMSPNGTRVYVADRSTDTVSVIDTSTNTVVATVEVGDDPRGLGVTPNGSFLYVLNEDDDDVTVIATATNTVVGDPIDVGNGPREVAFTSNRAFVTNTQDSDVSVIDTTTHTNLDDNIAVGDEPKGIAVGPAQADLGITKSDSPDPVNLGGNITYSIVATNHGSDGSTGVTVKDALPSSVQFVSASASKGSCSGTTTVTCDIGTLLKDQSATVTIVVKANAAGTVSNTATVSSAATADGLQANNQATTTTSVLAADLAITKLDSPDPVTVGGSITYTITAQNNGPSAAGGVSVTDTLPAGATFVSASASQGSCSGTAPVVCALGSLASGASATVTIVVRPSGVGTAVNSASVASNVTDPNTANNSATAQTTVRAVPVVRRPAARDRIKPTIAIAGIPRACTSGAFTARVTIRDASALRSGTISVDGRRIRSTASKRYSVRISARTLRVGAHRITVTAIDRAGNRTTRTVSFRRCGVPQFTG